MNADPTAKYLAAYPPELRAQVRGLIAEGQLARNLEQRYPDRHDIASDGALYDYVNGLKSRCMRSAGPLSKAVYDSRLRLTQQALGTHTVVSRLQGGSLKAKREIRIASLFREAPTALLRMIVVHELAHLKERDHDNAFYALCVHMEPDYHQLKFDVRLWLTAMETGGAAGWCAAWAVTSKGKASSQDWAESLALPGRMSAASGTGPSRAPAVSDR
jgi:predicted metal-dependent hydrolase